MAIREEKYGAVLVLALYRDSPSQLNILIRSHFSNNHEEISLRENRNM